MKKFRPIALLIAAAVVFSGCSVIKVNPERDGAQVVAEVNGAQITKKQVYDKAGITWTQKIESWEVEDYKTKKAEALESMIQAEVIKQKCKELGYYNFTADEQKQIDDALASYIKTTYDEALAKYQKQAETDSSIKPEEKANADVDAFLQQNGYTRDSYKQQQADGIAQEKAYKAATDNVTPTEDEIKSAYDSLLSQEKSTFDSDASQISMYELYYGYPILYFPQDGFVRVKQILVSLPDDVQTEISTLRNDKKDEEANKKRDDELAKIAAKANEALTKAKDANADLTKLNALITEYGTDPGMTADNPGYLVYKDSKDYVQQFTDAAMKLTDVGKPSDLVATDYGYHILWLTEKIAKGEVALDKVKDKMTEIAKAQKQNSTWSTTVSGWVDELKSKTKRYENRLNN